MMQKPDKELSAIVRISKFMTFLQPGDTIKAFIEPLYGYCQPAWMFYSRRANVRIRGH